jgi:hypothetical protein
MSPVSEYAQMLRALEEQLLEPSVRASVARLDELIAEDFLEFASIGRAFDKAGIIDGVRAEQAHGHYVRPVIRDFDVRRLSDDVALVSYRAERQGVNGALRSSIWRHSGGRWQIVFHQGTIVPAS